MVAEKVCPPRGKFLVMNRHELLGFSLQTRRNKRLLCNDCNDCYNCKRFEFIKEEMDKNAFLLETLVQKRSPGRNSQYCGKFSIMKTLKKTNLILKFIFIKSFYQIF